MIPKKFHYCWFGGSELPDQYKAYIQEWQDLHPDFEIIRWDESNSPMDLAYMQSAQKHNLTSRMANLIRIYAMVQHGGIYLDTDMKLLKPLYDLLGHSCFLGFESGSEDSSDFHVNNAIIGSQPNHPFMKRCYDKLLELFEEDEQKTLYLLSPVHTTTILKEEFGLQKYGNQLLKDKIQLYASEYFYPIPWNLSKRTHSYQKYTSDCTYAVHMWGRTWFSKEKMLGIIDDLQDELFNKDDQIAQYKNQMQAQKQYIDKLAEENSTLINRSLLEVAGVKIKQKLKKLIGK
jgi:mannosyltransferase OCH1-like enzyme